MKHFLPLLLSLLLLCSSACADTPEREAEALFTKYKTTGGALLVSKYGNIVHEQYFGYRDKKAGVPVDADTYFRLASVSKMVSAIGVMQLAEGGVLDLDRDLSDYYGFALRHPDWPEAPITARMLLSHTSSVSPDGAYQAGSGNLSVMLNPGKRRMANWYSFRPGTQYRYSNLGGGMFGSVIELLSGQNVDDYMRENVFSPLGISASYDLSRLPDAEGRASTSYQPNGSIKDKVSMFLSRGYDGSCDPDTHFLSTDAELWMTPKSLLTIGQMMCRGGSLGSAAILQSATVAAMLENQNGRGGITADSPYGLGIYHDTSLLGETMVYGHQGLSGGILINCYWVPESDFVFVLVTNGCDNRMDDHIGLLSRRLFAMAWDAYLDIEPDFVVEE